MKVLTTSSKSSPNREWFPEVRTVQDVLEIVKSSAWERVYESKHFSEWYRDKDDSRIRIYGIVE